MTQVIGEVGEKHLLREILLPLVNPTMDPFHSGDDAGLVDIPDGHYVCASTDRVPWDLTARRLGLMSDRELGYYLAALNVSDIAAMGARPIGLLLNFALPASFPVAALVELVGGVLEASIEFKAPILGGDLSDSVEPSLSATSLGVGRRGSYLLRGGAEVGDAIYTTGPCGLAAAALRYFTEAVPLGLALPAAQENELRVALLRPVPRLQTGQALARAGVRVTAMDNTDGLSQCLYELAEASSVHFAIGEDLLRLHPLVCSVADLLGENPVEIAMKPGADFHLVGTISDRVMAKNLDLCLIGAVESGDGLSLADGDQRRALVAGGWNYFRSEGSR